KPEHVEGKHPIMRSEYRYGLCPVAVCVRAGAAAMDENDGLAVALVYEMRAKFAGIDCSCYETTHWFSPSFHGERRRKPTSALRQLRRCQHHLFFGFRPPRPTIKSSDDRKTAHAATPFFDRNVIDL